MKATNILYWIFTGLFAIAMLFSSYASILQTKEAVDMIHGGMGFPAYIIPFTGWMKVLGVIGILIPGFPRIKEWAYAGLFFDLLAATYSIIAMGTPFAQWWGMLIFIGLGVLSYYFYRKRLNGAPLPSRA